MVNIRKSTVHTREFLAEVDFRLRLSKGTLQCEQGLIILLRQKERQEYETYVKRDVVDGPAAGVLGRHDNGERTRPKNDADVDDVGRWLTATETAERGDDAGRCAGDSASEDVGTDVCWSREA